MRIASFNGGRIGIVRGDQVTDVTACQAAEPGAWPPAAMLNVIRDFAHLRPVLQAAAGPAHRLADIRLETPVAWPNKVIAFPANYHAHIDEMKQGLISTFKADGQGFFLKANSSLSGPADPIVLPAAAGREIHHECELAVIIGTGGRDIPLIQAMAHVFGYACLVDVVIRGKEERVMRKSFDSFCPVGPWITTADEIADYRTIDLALSVNGVERQRANTRDLIVGIPEMIVMASSVMTLCPGDIIASGTPAGVGPMCDGDVLTITIAGVGEMTLNIRQGEAGAHQLWNKPA